MGLCTTQTLARATAVQPCCPKVDASPLLVATVMPARLKVGGI